MNEERGMKITPEMLLEDRRRYLQGLSPEDLDEEISKFLLGQKGGVFIPDKRKAIETILDVEFDRRSATVMMTCEACEQRSPHLVPYEFTDKDGKRCEKAACPNCGAWKTEYRD